MGLFDKFKSKDVVSDYKPRTEQEAWMGIIYGCVAADGEVSDEEINLLAGMFNYNSFYKGFDPMELYKIVGMEHIKIGSKKLIEACVPLVSEENKATLFSIITRLVLADGIIDDNESELMEYLLNAMNLEKSIAEKIIEVVIIMHKYEVFESDDFDDEDDDFD